MKKAPLNGCKPWTNSDIVELKKLNKQNTPTPLIGYKLGRSTSAIYGKTNALGLSVKPTNQSPYGLVSKSKGLKPKQK
ncbi:MAG: hypothetical protein WCO66_03485 [Candidatus Absconditabacteria bacterium]